jgi:hypothetical protein
MSQKITIPVIKPRDYQLAFWKSMDEGSRYAVLSWPRRHGKDVTCFSYMVRQAMQEVGTYYYCFPTLEDGKEILWNNSTTIDNRSGFMVDLLCPPEIVANKNNQDYMLKLINGSVIRIKGTDSGKVVGNDGKGFVFSEWQNQKAEVFNFIRPIIRQNNGWAIFNGTMRGKENHLYKDIIRNEGVPEWFSQWLMTKDTKTDYWISPEDEDPDLKLCINPELEGEISPYTGRMFRNLQWEVDSGGNYAKVRQEFLNEAVCMVENSYYGYELDRARKDKRVGLFPVDKQEKTYTFWDLGGASDDSDETTVVFAQERGEDLIVVDYYENTGHKLEHYRDMLVTRGYNYGGHYAPHDASKKMLFGDLITKGNEIGLHFERVPKTKSVASDIEVVRRRFKSVYIHEDLCGILLGHLENYHEGGSGKPCHNKNCKMCNGASHGADAFRTMMMAYELSLVRDYLTGGNRQMIKLPDSVGEAEEYVDGFFGDDGKRPLWETFR